MAHYEIRSWAGIPSIESMILRHHLHGWAMVLECLIAECSIACFIVNYVRATGVLVDKRNALRITSSRSLKSATFHFIGWKFLHPTELPGGLSVPLVYHILMLNMVVLQLSDAINDTSMLTSRFYSPASTLWHAL